LKDLNDKYNKTVSDYEKLVKELNDKLNKTVNEYEKVIKDLNVSYNKCQVLDVKLN